MRWAEHVACTEDRKDANKLLMDRYEAQRLFGRFIHIWNNNIKMDLQEAARGGGMDWIDLAHDMTSGGVL
jgi:hypothetical protein